MTLVKYLLFICCDIFRFFNMQVRFSKPAYTHIMYLVISSYWLFLFSFNTCYMYSLTCLIVIALPGLFLTFPMFLSTFVFHIFRPTLSEPVFDNLIMIWFSSYFFIVAFLYMLCIIFLYLEFILLLFMACSIAQQFLTLILLLKIKNRVSIHLLYLLLFSLGANDELSKILLLL